MRAILATLALALIPAFVGTGPALAHDSWISRERITGSGRRRVPEIQGTEPGHRPSEQRPLCSSDNPGFRFAHPGYDQT